MSRDGNGNYTPPLNPVVGGQPIEADWANDTINDLAAALTDSLSRSGNGNMLAPFRATDGTITIPSISFTNEPNSGLYRAGTGDYRLCVNGKDKARIRDVNGMAAFQVFDLAGTGAWETLATSAEVGAITLADVLAVGNSTGGTNLQVSASDDLLLSDTSKLKFETDGSNYLQIYKSAGAAGTSYIHEVGGGALVIKGESGYLRNDNDESQVTWNADGVTLGYDGSGVLDTTATGIDVTGTVDCDGLKMDDGEYAQFGTSNDLQIFHNGTNSYIQDVGTGILSIQSNGDSITFHDSANTRNMAQFNTGGTALLSWAGGTGTGVKLETTETGIDVTGTVEADGFSGTGTVAITDFVTDVSTNDNDSTVPTTAAVKSYVDSAGGYETLAETLALGNTTGANDIEMTDGAEITSSQQNGISLNSTSGFRVVSGSSGPFSMGQAGTNIGITNISGIPGLPPGSLLLATGQGNPTNSAMICNGTDVKFYDNIRLNSSSVNILSDGDIITKHDATGETALQSSGGVHRVQATETFAALYFGADAATTAAKLQTSDTGVTVTGTVTADGVSLGDDDRIVLGAGSDLQIYHAGSLGGTNYIIAGSGTPSLTIGAGTNGSIDLSVAGGAVVIVDADGLRTNGGGVISSQAGYDVKVQAAVGYGVNLTSSGGLSRVSATETQAQLFYGASAAAGAKKLETVDAGVDITGDLDVTGTITSNAFAYSKATVNNAADILYTAFNSFAGKRIINTASATNTTYGLPTPVAADIGKSWIICNPTDSEITIDHDASGTANYVWIMDGVTLSAAASSWTIKKGAVVEIVVAAAAAGGGSSTAPNYLIFGAGLLEIV